MSSKGNPFPLPPNTTFGNAPVVTDVITLKAYITWLIVRGLYEGCRLLLWYAVTNAITRVIDAFKGMNALTP